MALFWMYIHWEAFVDMTEQDIAFYLIYFGDFWH